jgi:biotin transport system substrate-specific component
MQPTVRYGTLADALVPRVDDRAAELVRDAVLVVAGVVLVGLLAQITVPWHPVPLTGQTFGVLLVGGVLGLWRAVASLSLYFAVGLVGLPVFQDGNNGWDYVQGPTGGYIVGFIIAAGIVGYMAERGLDRRVVPMIGAMLLGTVVIYALGAAWLAYWTPPGADEVFGWSGAYESGVQPFLLGDLVKLGAAAALLPCGWALVQRLGIGPKQPPAGLM